MYSQTYADTTKERVERITGEARDKLELLLEFVTDSTEMANAVGYAQEAIHKAEGVANEIIDRRTERES